MRPFEGMPMRMLSRDSTGRRVTGERTDGSVRNASCAGSARTGGRSARREGEPETRLGWRAVASSARACVPRSRDRISRVRTRGGALLLADAGDRGDARRRRATRRNPADRLSPIGALRREARRRERREARDGRHLCERTRLCHVSVASAVLPVGDDVARTVVPRAIFPRRDQTSAGPSFFAQEDLSWENMCATICIRSL